MGYRNYSNYSSTTNSRSKGGDFPVSDTTATEAVQYQPLEVLVTDSLDRAMKIFRAMVQRDRILSSYKERSRYEKPSDKKRRKRNERQRKLLELERNVQQDDQE